ncbi:MAG: chromate transporter [Eubacteriales bacterium]|jgi:chromate transporter
MLYLTVCWEFFKIGLFAVGGGLATLPFLADLTVSHPEWFDMEMLSNMVAVSNSTPGPMGINMATYVGFTVGGVPGGILATLSEVAPSIIVIMLVARMLNKFKESPWVQGAFRGLRPAVTALIALAGVELLQLAFFRQELLEQTGQWTDFVNWPAVVFFVAMVPLVRRTKWPILVYILIGAAAGILLHL